ncbi:tetratricopeptide repeat protein [Minwuia thermotolerans]|uniref:tetratricopeptide repeat protein n=1 Tax=Minwuia thermotolerans TaxID=2056226 RepID=UPI0013DE2BCF|nr:tetratricopeptide repeat protein [Minwuia thermotolerans]
MLVFGAVRAEAESPLTGEVLQQRCEDDGLPTRLQKSYCGVSIALGAHPSATITVDDLIEQCPDQTEPYNSWALDSAFCSVLAHHATDPDIRAAAYYESAYALDEIGAYDEAIIDLDRALELRPGDYDALVNRGLAKRKAGRLHEAVADYDLAIEAEPGRMDAYNNRGTVFLRQERYDRAIADFQKALDLQPGNSLTRFNLGLALQHKGRLRAALANYEALAAAGDAIGEVVDIAFLHGQRAEAYADLNDGPAAVAAYEDVVSHDPSVSAAHFMLAQFRAFGPEEVRDFDKALFHAEENLRLDPADGVGVYVLARIHAAKGDIDAAVATHRRLADNHWVYKSVYISVLKRKGYLAADAPEDEWSDAAQAALTECARENCTILNE